MIRTKRFLFILFGILVALGALPYASRATEEFAAATNRDCGYCHLSSSGGGELSEAGRAYRLALFPPGNQGQPPPSSPRPLVSGLFKLAVGYVHILTGFFWFGTILYVHLILKPAYASTGLPRGEVRLGLVSMAIMAITGTILTLYRVPSIDNLFTTRFGILLLVKIGLFIIMVCTALFVVLVLGPRLKRKSPATSISGDEISPENLSGFDGQEGRPAYIAYEGTIYDVTNSRLWNEGLHLKRHRAGFDLTDQLPLAPHGDEKIKNMPFIGNLASGQTEPAGLQPRQVFFFMAYLNLGIVMLIILILALWKWW